MFPTVKGNVAVSEHHPAAQHGVLRAVGVIAAATLASRVLGFVRDVVVARAFGAGPVTDAFFVAFRIPNLLRRLLAEGALNAQHRFFTAALGPAVLNVAMILSVLVLAGRLSPPVFSLAVGVLVGGVGQLLVQLPELRKLGVSLRPSAEWSHPAVRMIAGRLWPAVFALAAVQVT